MTGALRSWCTLVVLATAPVAAAAQLPADSADTSAGRAAAAPVTLDGAAVDALPLDSVGGALLLLPGFTPGTATVPGVALRGAPAGYRVSFVDGVDVTPGTAGVGIQLPTNALAGLRVEAGPLPADRGNSTGGALDFRLARAGALAPRLSYERDGVLGSRGVGLARLEGATAFRGRHWRLALAGTLQAERSADFGAGAGDSPMFVPAGVDTTLTVSDPSGPQQVTFPAFGIYRGSCRLADSAATAPLRDNYGVDCQGDRTPYTGRSNYRLAARLDYDLKGGATLSLLGLRSRDQDRLLDWATQFNPAARFGSRSASSVYAATVTTPLGGSRTARPVGHFGISRQSNEEIAGPLTPDNEADTREPSLLGGLRPLDFRWDFTTFPVDSALVANYRSQIPGTRRSPYSLKNTAQYQYDERFAINPWGAAGFPTAGGPLGRIRLARESRTLAFFDVAWAASRNSRVTVGGSHTWYAADDYDHELTSGVRSSVYRQHPVRGALYAEEVFEYGHATLSAGIRYDFFNSRADRPLVLDTIPFLPGTTTPNPAYGTYLAFPRIASSQGTWTDPRNGQTLSLTSSLPDARHSVWSPRVRGSLSVGPRTTLRAALTREARMPDFGSLYAGLNTDLAITTTAQPFATDLDWVRSWNAELGVHQQLGTRTALDLSGWRRSVSGDIADVVTPGTDPARFDSPVSLVRVVNGMNWRGVGLDLSFTHQSGPLLAVVGYSFQRVRLDSGGPALPWERPHTFTTALGIRASRSLIAWAGFRWSSGAPYTPCGANPADLATLSGQPCVTPPNPGALGSARLPGWRQLDLRLTEAIRLAGRVATVFLDGRNVLNRANTAQVFAATGNVTNPSLETLAVSGYEGDVRGEAQANGRLDPDGTVDLSFAGANGSGCASWVNATGTQSAPPDCFALVRAEQRFGNGDGRLSPAEQQTIGQSMYAGMQSLLGLRGPPRRVRAGIAIEF